MLKKDERTELSNLLELGSLGIREDIAFGELVLCAMEQGFLPKRKDYYDEIQKGVMVL